MAGHRRVFIAGGSYFFTLCLEQRGSTLLTDRIAELRAAWQRTFREFPVRVEAMVILPDHLHAVLTEPEGEVNFPERWRRMKARFSHAVPDRPDRPPRLLRKRERGIWQRRYWEHCLRDGASLHAAVEFCRWNPVRHGLTEAPDDWPYLFIRADRTEGQDRPRRASGP